MENALLNDLGNRRIDCDLTEPAHPKFIPANMETCMIEYVSFFHYQLEIQVPLLPQAATTDRISYVPPIYGIWPTYPLTSGW
jgi:hypothetical protein